MSRQKTQSGFSRRTIVKTAAGAGIAVEEQVHVLLVRLDAAVDVVVSELERGRR